MTTTRNLNSLQGNVVSSSTATDLAVQGSGFFVVSDSSGATYLTRNGSFVADASGNLVNSAGYYLMGNDVQSGSAPPANALSTLQKVNVASAGETATPTTSASIVANLPSSATPIAAADLPSANSASSTYTDITSLVVYDNLGGAHTINLYLANTGANSWEVDAFDALRKRQLAAAFRTPPALSRRRTLTFDPTTGSLSSGSPLTIPVPNGQTMSLDLSNLTQLAASFSVSSATANGNAPASLQGVSIAADGTLSFNYTNGATIAAYDIPLANVASPDNLTSVNGNAFSANSASGPVYPGDCQRRQLRHNRLVFARKLDRRSRDRAYRHDPGAERLRSQFQGVPDRRQYSRRAQRTEGVSLRGPKESAMSLSAAFNIISSSFAANSAQTARRLEQHRQRQYARLLAPDRQSRHQFLRRRRRRLGDARGQRGARRAGIDLDRAGGGAAGDR